MRPRKGRFAVQHTAHGSWLVKEAAVTVTEGAALRCFLVSRLTGKGTVIVSLASDSSLPYLDTL